MWNITFHGTVPLDLKRQKINVYLDYINVLLAMDSRHLFPFNSGSAVKACISFTLYIRSPGFVLANAKRGNQKRLWLAVCYAAYDSPLAWLTRRLCHGPQIFFHLLDCSVGFKRMETTVLGRLGANKNKLRTLVFKVKDIHALRAEPEVSRMMLANETSSHSLWWFPLI